MWLGTKTVKHLPIGMDLGSSSLKMAQLETSKTGLELLAAGSVEIPHEYRDDTASRLRFQFKNTHHVLRSCGFNGRKVILSLPASSTFIQQVKIPVALSKHLDEAIKNELSGKLTYPVGDAIIRHCLVGSVHESGEEMQERFVVAASRSDVDTYLEMAQHAGLEVVGVDIEACAVVECFARLFRTETDESRVTLFVDIGWSTTQVVLAHGRKMAFARNLPVGGQSLDRMVAETLGIPIDQACHIRQKMISQETNNAAEDDLFRLLDAKIAEITDEIIRCVRYHESVFIDRAIERVIFVGGQAHNSRLCQCIAKRLNLPAQIGDPMAGIKWANEGHQEVGLDCRVPQPAWAVAIGLSLGATITPFGNGVEKKVATAGAGLG